MDLVKTGEGDHQELDGGKVVPLVSVITVVRNGAAHIAEAINSVVVQDYPNIEHIVIDGGSTDGTQEIIERNRSKLAYYVSEPDRGISHAWNKGVAVAKGDYIAFLNADDYYLPSFVRRSVAAATGAANEIIYGATLVISESGTAEQVVDGSFKPDRIRHGFGFRHPACLTHRDLFQKVGAFDEAVRIACDTDFLLRCVRSGASFRKSRAVVCMRRGGISDRQWRNAALEHLARARAHGFSHGFRARLDRWLIPARVLNRKLGLVSAARWLKTQAYFLGLATLNCVHGAFPFFLRPMLYRMCGYQIHPGASLQGGIRFFHVGRLAVGDNTLINRGTYLDNRGGIRIGAGVSIAHDVKIYSLGHEIHDDLFTTKGGAVNVEDYVVIFAGAMIMPGVTLGRACVVMAGSVVTKDVAPLQIVGGNPARPIGVRDSHPVYQLRRRYWFAH